MRNDDHIDSDDSDSCKGSIQKQRSQPLSTNLKVAIGITAGMLLGAIAMSIFMHNGEPQEAEISTVDSVQEQSISTQAGSAAYQAAKPIGAFAGADPAAAALVLQAQQQATQTQDQKLAPSQTSEDITSDRMGIQPAQTSGDPQTLSETVSGYPIYYSGAPKAVDAGADNPSWNVTRSGLVGNPCVDPPSTQGRAYKVNGTY